MNILASSGFAEIMYKIKELTNAVLPYLIIISAVILIVWGIYIGIRVATAKKNEQQLNTKAMAIHLIIGVVVIFAVIVIAPLTINALCSWSGVDITTISISSMPTETEAGSVTYTNEITGDTTVTEIPSLSSTDYTYEVTKEATCTEEGEATYTWNEDSSVVITVTLEIDENAHTYGDDNICIYCGISAGSSQVCNHTQTITDNAVVATCTETGLTEGSHCADCGETLIVQETTQALGHNYESIVTDPTCTEQGYTTYTCTRCRDSYVGDYTDATGHTYTTVITEPTCTKQGYTTHTCTECGDSYIDSYVNSTGHSYTTIIIEPTCTEEGYTIYTCKECGYSYNSDYTEATGHTPDGEGEIITAATYTSTGTIQYTCSHCGEIYTEEIPMLTIAQKTIASYNSDDAYATYGTGSFADSGDGTALDSQGVFTVLGGFSVKHYNQSSYYYGIKLDKSKTSGDNYCIVFTITEAMLQNGTVYLEVYASSSSSTSDRVIGVYTSGNTKTNYVEGYTVGYEASYITFEFTEAGTYYLGSASSAWHLYSIALYTD